MKAAAGGRSVADQGAVGGHAAPRVAPPERTEVIGREAVVSELERLLFGAQTAQLFAEHASVATFVATTVDQPPFLAAVKHLSAARTNLVLLQIVIDMIVGCISSPGI